MLLSFPFLWLRGIFRAVSTAAVPLVVIRSLCWELQGLGQAARLLLQKQVRRRKCGTSLHFYSSAKSEWNCRKQRKGTLPPGGLHIKHLLHEEVWEPLKGEVASIL